MLISSSLCQPYSIDQDSAHILPPVPVHKRLRPVCYSVGNIHSPHQYISPSLGLRWNGCSLVASAAHLDVCLYSPSSLLASRPDPWASSHSQTLPFRSSAVSLSTTHDPAVWLGDSRNRSPKNESSVTVY